MAETNIQQQQKTIWQKTLSGGKREVARVDVDSGAIRHTHICLSDNALLQHLSRASFEHGTQEDSLKCSSVFLCQARALPSFNTPAQCIDSVDLNFPEPEATSSIPTLISLVYIAKHCRNEAIRP